MGGGAWRDGICLNKDEKNGSGGSQGRGGGGRRQSKRTAVPRSFGSVHLPISPFAPSDCQTIASANKIDSSEDDCAKSPLTLSQNRAAVGPTAHGAKHFIMSSVMVKGTGPLINGCASY